MLVIDASSSMKKSDQPGFDTRMDAANALAKKIVGMVYLSSTDLAARFSVVSFNETARMRVPWSTDDGDIDAAIDAISPDGQTSISAGLHLARELLEDARDNATKVVLLLLDGKQSDHLGGSAAAIAAAQDLKTVGGKVFAWGFGDELERDTLVAIAGDESMAQFTDDVSELFDFLTLLVASVCNDPPPLLPPPPPSPLVPPPPPSPLAPPPSPKPPCVRPIDFALVLDESGSMAGYMEGEDGLKAFAKELVRHTAIEPR